MPAIDAKNPKSLTYPHRTQARAGRSLRCSPFQMPLFEAMRLEGVSLKLIALDAGIQHGYTKRPLSELRAENALLWLIQVGVLRREVDGQGITDSFRLTPLGRQLVEQYQASASRPTPSWRDRAIDTLNRWLRLPL
ncbi:MAG: hypothetical protein JO235_13575 [Chroococcidiopsidaceae cyanobacterium CP_BM_RX_35]|nr:hypothetical protein [Chroococcidiopsidaceae cyanobacterium CP_BM_RX_35]